MAIYKAPQPYLHKGSQIMCGRELTLKITKTAHFYAFNKGHAKESHYELHKQ